MGVRGKGPWNKGEGEEDSRRRAGLTAAIAPPSYSTLPSHLSTPSCYALRAVTQGKREESVPTCPAVDPRLAVAPPSPCRCHSVHPRVAEPG
ncbi:uncharacterized protein DS421_16g547190 [Arachis hypogaea]|nr:uncharacterized protein DS421_16g547190 [Arachis hypogaea]